MTPEEEKKLREENYALQRVITEMNHSSKEETRKLIAIGMLLGFECDAPQNVIVGVVQRHVNALNNANLELERLRRSAETHTAVGEAWRAERDRLERTIEHLEKELHGT